VGSKIKGVEKTIRIFHSFEEADAANDLERAQMTPQHRADIFFALKEMDQSNASEQGFARVYRVLELEQS